MPQDCVRAIGYYAQNFVVGLIILYPSSFKYLVHYMSIRLFVDAKLKVSQCCYYTQCMLVCSLGVAQLGRGVIYFDSPASSTPGPCIKQVLELGKSSIN